jgi:hypothetical protein
VRGVRPAQVMTTSSACLAVLLTHVSETLPHNLRYGEAYMAETPEEPGVNCLRIEESLSAAILNYWMLLKVLWKEAEIFADGRR